MAGIESLLKGAVGSFAKDKALEFMSPQQMELARFALSPQAYLADKGIAAVANLLGYGNQYQELKAGAEGEKAYGKEVARDAVGDMLPNAVGDFVRATPRGVDEPAGTYTAWNPETQTYVQQASSQPVVTTGTSDTFDNFVRDLNYGTQTPGQGKHVGPLPEDNPLFQSKVSNLPYELKSTPVSGAPEDFDPALLASIMRGDVANVSDVAAPPGYKYDPETQGMIPTTQAPIDFGGTMDYGDMFGGGGGKLEDYFLQAQNAHKRGGFIYRGGR